MRFVFWSLIKRSPAHLSGGASKHWELISQRESSDNPMLNAFWRVAPSVRFNFSAILPAGVFLRAIVFRSRTCADVHARLFFPFVMRISVYKRRSCSSTLIKRKAPLTMRRETILRFAGAWMMPARMSADCTSWCGTSSQQPAS
jgi:hypothetical protein